MNIRAYLGNLNKDSYIDIISQGLDYIKFGELVSSNTQVFIKPNLTYPMYRHGVMTNPEAVKAAILAIREYTSNIVIGDADSGGYNRFSMDEVYKETGLWEFTKNNGVEIVNLSNTKRKTVQISFENKQIDLDLPSLLTDDIDLLITMPVPKIHANTGVSLSFKNQWGCIPEPADRLRLHPYFKHVILEVNKAVKSRISIIDGMYGLNFNGPMLGTPIELEWVMISNNIGASARLACELMQIQIEKIEHLRFAIESGSIPKRSEIETNTEIFGFQKEKFELHRKITDIPGYLAFNSPFLAYLGYFSPVSDLLHRILYLFREPLYDYDKYSRSK